MSPLMLAIIVVIIGLYILYILLIVKKNKVKEAASGIEVQLKKRYDLIPNILTMANKFMEHEKGLMEEITKLRTDAMATDFSDNPHDKAKLEEMLADKMKELLISVENYPDLKSNQTMLEAMQTFNEVEEHIAASRRFYNSAVNDLKNRIEIFPSNMVAKLIGIKDDMPLFEAEDDAKKSINSRDYFK